MKTIIKAAGRHGFPGRPRVLQSPPGDRVDLLGSASRGEGQSHRRACDLSLEESMLPCSKQREWRERRRWPHLSRHISGDECAVWSLCPGQSALAALAGLPLLADAAYLQHWQADFPPPEVAAAIAQRPVTHVSWFAARACAAGSRSDCPAVRSGNSSPWPVRRRQMGVRTLAIRRVSWSGIRSLPPQCPC